VYRLLAELTMVTHFAYLVFVAVGGFLAWRWPRAIVPHLTATAAGVVIFAGSLNCPLTWAEDRLRRRAGQPGLPRGFVDTYLDGVLYPERAARWVLLLAGALIVASWLGAYLRWRQRRYGACTQVRNGPVTQYVMPPDDEPVVPRWDEK